LFLIIGRIGFDKEQIITVVLQVSGVVVGPHHVPIGKDNRIFRKIGDGCRCYKFQVWIVLRVFIKLKSYLAA
jgi:hypothetical protein